MYVFGLLLKYFARAKNTSIALIFGFRDHCDRSVWQTDKSGQFQSV